MARKKYDIVGIDGNAYSIMGYVSTAMAQECEAMGWDAAALKKEKDAYLNDAMSGDYNHLVAVSADMVDRVNKAISGGSEDDDEG